MSAPAGADPLRLLLDHLTGHTAPPTPEGACQATGLDVAQLAALLEAPSTQAYLSLCTRLSALQFQALALREVTQNFLRLQDLSFATRPEVARRATLALLAFAGLHPPPPSAAPPSVSQPPQAALPPSVALMPVAPAAPPPSEAPPRASAALLVPLLAFLLLFLALPAPAASRWTPNPDAPAIAARDGRTAVYQHAPAKPSLASPAAPIPQSAPGLLSSPIVFASLRAGMPIITVRDLQKSFRVATSEPGLWNNFRHFFRRTYRSVEAVKPLSFAIEPGEFVGFLGPNGAGKTTTLKMLSGLIHPSGGAVEVAGHVPFRRARPFLRQITLVMGNKQQLIWDLPAAETFRINGAVYDIPVHELRRRVEELAAMLHLGPEIHQPVRKLSLGERMKCELLASLLHHPRVLFLDEPTLGLDVNAQSAVRAFLREYNARFNATILLTSHYMADITALCRRVLLIHHGSLFYDGPLAGIIDRFAPYREVKLDLSQPVDRAALEPFGQIAAHEGRSAALTVRREALTATVERMLAELPIADLTVSDPPIENIIGELFTQGAVR